MPTASVTELWPWLVIAGLGAFHGVNPAMGWLFAVALGLHRQSRNVVLLSLLPIALGHAVSIWLIAAAAVVLGWVVEPRLVAMGSGIVLLAWAAYHWRFGHGRRVVVGMQTGLLGLGLWSFLMATAHGAGLMLLPAIMPLCVARLGPSANSIGISLAAVGLHTLSMLLTTAIVAICVFDWLGVAFLRRGWINLDRLWTAALAATGAVLLAVPGAV